MKVLEGYPLIRAPDSPSVAGVYPTDDIKHF
jgi:hypothetical protein